MQTVRLKCGRCGDISHPDDLVCPNCEKKSIMYDPFIRKFYCDNCKIIKKNSLFDQFVPGCKCGAVYTVERGLFGVWKSLLGLPKIILSLIFTGLIFWTIIGIIALFVEGERFIPAIFLGIVALVAIPTFIISKKFSWTSIGTLLYLAINLVLIAFGIRIWANIFFITINTFYLEFVVFVLFNFLVLFLNIRSSRRVKKHKPK